MTPGQVLRRMGPAMRGARLVRRLQVTPLKTSYLVEKDAQRFVLRVDEPAACALGLDREAEFANLQLAWRAGLAPEPVALRCGAQAVLLTRYVPGRAWETADLREPARLQRLAGLLRRLHALPGVGPVLDLEQALAHYARLAGGRTARQFARQAGRLLVRSGLGQGRPVFCHHDPTAANIVGFRRTLLIDWEYSARGEPLFDLAVVARHHRLPARLAERFAVAYFGSREQVPWERLQSAGQLYAHVQRLWLLAMATACSLTADQQRALALSQQGVM